MYIMVFSVLLCTNFSHKSQIFSTWPFPYFPWVIMFWGHQMHLAFFLLNTCRKNQLGEFFEKQTEAWKLKCIIQILCIVYSISNIVCYMIHQILGEFFEKQMEAWKLKSIIQIVCTGIVYSINNIVCYIK